MEREAIVDEPDPAVVAELREYEPIFHRGLALDAVERQLPPDFWEVGASGRRYSREVVLDVLRERYAHSSDDDPWTTDDFECREVGPDTYLLTYTLRQAERVSRRLTVWRRTGGHWQVLYHQGTLVAE